MNYIQGRRDAILIVTNYVCLGRMSRSKQSLNYYPPVNTDSRTPKPGT